MTAKRLGFFTRVLDNATAGERYRLAAEQIIHAERHGFDSAWVAQHHFHEHEGGLPSPFPFLAFVAARTSRIRLGTGVITLPMENPVRVAEDAAVLDLLSGGRVEVGVGTGGTPSSFEAFGITFDTRGPTYGAYLKTVLDAWRGDAIAHDENRMYPASPHLVDRVWQATFSVPGGTRAGEAGDGLMLSRTQPRSPNNPGQTLWDMQNPIIDAYLRQLPAGRAPRILGSRNLFVADDRRKALRLAEAGLALAAKRMTLNGKPFPTGTIEEIIKACDMHVGTPDDVLETLSRDTALARATDIVFQVHSADPPHEHILRSIELTAAKVAPALGWQRDSAAAQRPTALAG